jgi:hypothetical protein
MTKAFRAEWARILAGGEYEDAERAKLRRRGEDATEANRARVLYSVAMRVCDRWQAAGFTSATLVDGLPRPERPHATTWHCAKTHPHSFCARNPYPVKNNSNSYDFHSPNRTNTHPLWRTHEGVLPSI